MVTPFDIERKEFSKAMRGFNVDEVDSFLDEIILSMQELIDENNQLKLQMEAMKGQLSKYETSEASVMSTIESAKKLMNDISESAERRAEIIIKNAQLDAEVIQRDAKDSVAKLTEEGERLRERVSRYRERFRQLLEDELSQLDGSSEELFAELERDFMPASMDEEAAKRTAAQTAARRTIPPVPKTATEEVPAVSGSESDGQNAVPQATLVMDSKSIEDILRETYGAEGEASHTAAEGSGDLTKTRIF